MSRAVADRLTEQITSVIGLSRGGLVPATIVANHLNIRNVYSIGLASYELDPNNNIHIHKHDVYQQIPLDSPCMLKGETVLIVDDISDRGVTFQHVMQTYMAKADCNVITMSLFIKPETIYIPDYYHKSVSQDEWITFPWEKKVVAQKESTS